MFNVTHVFIHTVAKLIFAQVFIEELNMFSLMSLVIHL